MRFRIWLEREATEDTKRAIYEKATTTGIPARHGQGEGKSNRPYSSDPGDFGRGIYYDTSYHRAASYGRDVEKIVLKFKNPLVVTAKEAYKLSDKFGTVRLTDDKWEELARSLGLIGPNKRQGPRIHDVVVKELLKNAENMTKTMLRNGHDGLIVIHIRGNLEMVDYRPYED